DVSAGVRQHSEIEDGGDLRMLEIKGDLRFTAEAILRSRVSDGAGADEFDGDFLPGFVRRQKDNTRSAMTDHALQPVAHVDRVGDCFDTPQFYQTVAAKLNVRWVTAFARNAFTHCVVRIVRRHTSFSRQLLKNHWIGGLEYLNCFSVWFDLSGV